jgi:hypothetical protein
LLEHDLGVLVRVSLDSHRHLHLFRGVFDAWSKKRSHKFKVQSVKQSFVAVLPSNIFS